MGGDKHKIHTRRRNGGRNERRENTMKTRSKVAEKEGRKDGRCRENNGGMGGGRKR